MGSFVVGIDEVGRGALAGPVVVAAAIVPHGLKLDTKKVGPLRDSKKLSRVQRERWAKYFKNHKDIRFAFGRVYPRGIESMNISAAANVAAERAFARLSGPGASKKVHKNIPVFLDGGLFLGNGARRKKSKTFAKTLIKADEKIPAVAIASIVAKVQRDRFMRRLAKRYPVYGFEVHKGYGTKSHLRAIKKHGPCEAHRLTFLGLSATMEK